MTTVYDIYAEYTDMQTGEAYWSWRCINLPTKEAAEAEIERYRKFGDFRPCEIRERVRQ